MADSGQLTWKPWAGVMLLCIGLLGCASDRPAPVGELSKASDYSKIPRATLKGKQVKVKRGDTLYSIAWSAGVDFRKLAKWNRLKAPYTIYPGQVIALVAPTSQKSRPKPTKPATTKKTKPAQQVNQRVDRTKSKRYSESTPEKISSAKAKHYPSKVSKWVWPHRGKVIQGFSSREHGNKGIDIAGRSRDRIRAAASGKVVYAGNALKGFGNLIIIKHSEDYLTAYAHLSRFKVKEQQWVKAGQDIADIGKSGTDRIKLHFEVRYRGQSVNPNKFLPKR